MTRPQRGSPSRRAGPRECGPERIGVDDLIERAREIYTLPRVVVEISRLIRNPDTSAQNIADLVSGDPPLASKVLRAVNSAYYGFPRKVSNLNTAIVILGFKGIRNLVLTIGAIKGLSRPGRVPFDYRGFWIHCLAVAGVTESICQNHLRAFREEAFAVGLLHDMGKLLIVQEIPDLATQVLRRAEETGGILGAEMDVLGFNHAEVGGKLARRWSFPEGVVRTLGLHHTPGDGGTPDPMSAVVHIADIAVRAAGVGWAGDSGVPPVDPIVWNQFRDLVEPCFEALGMEVDRGLDLLNLVA